MNEILQIISNMDPEEAASQTAVALKQLMPLLGDEERAQFIMDIIGDNGRDKVSSMVHL